MKVAKIDNSKSMIVQRIQWIMLSAKDQDGQPGAPDISWSRRSALSWRSWDFGFGNGCHIAIERMEEIMVAVVRMEACRANGCRAVVLLFNP